MALTLNDNNDYRDATLRTQYFDQSFEREKTKTYSSTFYQQETTDCQGSKDSALRSEDPHTPPDATRSR
jgi:hypothetical protein